MTVGMNNEKKKFSHCKFILNLKKTQTFVAGAGSGSGALGK